MYYVVAQIWIFETISSTLIMLGIISDFVSPEGILRGVFQNFNPLCGRNPIENGSWLNH